MIHFGSIPATSVNFTGVEADEVYFQGYKVWPEIQTPVGYVAIQYQVDDVSTPSRILNGDPNLAPDPLFDSFWGYVIRDLDGFRYNGVDYELTSPFFQFNETGNHTIYFHLKGNITPRAAWGYMNRQWTYLVDNCAKVVGISLPSGLTAIGFDSFNTTYAQTVTFPETVDIVGKYAFINTGTVAFVFNSTTPPVLQTNAIKKWVSGGRYIYVPANAVNAYKTAEGWEDLASIIRPIS